ncbi:hypothetical protein, partial [Aurantimonas sp. C2-4-R8]|nr:hypothetical protein [Aurantimonas sp. C2-4-R8]
MRIEARLKRLRLGAAAHRVIGAALGKVRRTGGEARIQSLPSTLPIRLLPTPTKCGVRPFPGVKPVKGRRSCLAGDSEQR